MYCTFCYVLWSAFSCKAGEFLEMSAQECTQCAAGTYSLGSGLRLDEWDDIPPGFSSLATSPDNAPNGQNVSTCSRSVPFEESVLCKRLFCRPHDFCFLYLVCFKRYWFCVLFICLNRNKIQMHKRQHAYKTVLLTASQIYIKNECSQSMFSFVCFHQSLCNKTLYFCPFLLFI